MTDPIDQLILHHATIVYAPTYYCATRCYRRNFNFGNVLNITFGYDVISYHEWSNMSAVDWKRHVKTAIERITEWENSRCHSGIQSMRALPLDREETVTRRWLVYNAWLIGREMTQQRLDAHT